MGTGIIFNNRILDVVFISMVSAQLYKLIESLFRKRKIIWTRLWETGGMPSSHSSSVVALTTAIGITQGLNTGAFAVSTVLSVIVMYDAAGIRKAAGEHAGVINQLTEFIIAAFDKRFKNEKLKELLGHSYSEVLAGAILGFLIGFLLKGYLLG
ncbi:MAG: divergent PAP2 family protein [Bacteroidota bacterium]|nr:divergent PAP2 family protein [Bacteroidota bacterium]